MNHMDRNLMPKAEVMNVEWVEIKTYADSKYEFNSTAALELFQLKRKSSDYCFELAIPDELKNEGVSKISLQAEFRKAYFYQKGWIPSDRPKVYYKDASKLILKHELVHLKDYDGKPCIEDYDYRHDICRLDFIQNVSHKAFKMRSAVVPKQLFLQKYVHIFKEIHGEIWLHITIWTLWLSQQHMHR